MIVRIRSPRVMCTQHPDSVCRYMSTQEGLNEAVEAAINYSLGVKPLQ